MRTQPTTKRSAALTFLNPSGPARNETTPTSPHSPVTPAQASDGISTPPIPPPSGAMVRQASPSRTPEAIAAQPGNAHSRPHSQPAAEIRAMVNRANGNGVLAITAG